MEGVNARLVLAVVSSACWSAFQHGYNTGVLNAPQKIMMHWINEDVLGDNSTFESAESVNANGTHFNTKVTAIWSVVVSVYCAGGMIGGVITGLIADRFGRKGGLLINNALVFVGAAMEGSAKAANSYELLILGRLLIGINSGLNAGLAPMYLAEISPVNLRGSIGTVYQLVITMTILLSQVLGLDSVLGTSDGWPWLLALCALPAVLQCATLPLCPESPKYLLLNRGQELEAQRGETLAPLTTMLWQVFGLDSVLGTSDGWPWLLALCALPAVLQCAMLPLCPESPKYLLLNRGQELEAQRGETLAPLTTMLWQVFGLDSVLGTSDGWPWLLALCALPAVLQCAMLPLCPESPKYLLLNRGQELEAQRALSWLRGDCGVHSEMEEMHQEAEKNKISKLVTLGELIRNRSLRAPLLIAVVVMLAQQLSGINAVMFYSTEIFKKANLGDTEAQYATIGMGAMNVIMTVVSLLLVEMAGRKTLLLAGFFGMFIVTAFLTLAMQFVTVTWVTYACIALVILFVVMFATGPGSIPWFLVTELFNQSARPAAASVAVTVNWTANFLVGLSFPMLVSWIQGYVFVIFALLQLVFVAFIWFKVPETKNKTVEEITAMFRQHL